MYMLLIATALMLQAQPEWKKGLIEDVLEAKSYYQFTTSGVFLDEPRFGDKAKPTLNVRCYAGKFIGADLYVGANIDGQAEKKWWGYQYSAFIALRWDGKTSADHSQTWEISKDLKSARIPDKYIVKKLLTGGQFPNKGWTTDPSKLIRSLYIGVGESGGGTVLMLFAMPPDISDLVASCGLK